jgi:hypothetical protein
LITDKGIDHLLKYQARIVLYPANFMVLGVGTAAAAGDDTNLNFEAQRLPIDAINADLANNRLVFSSTIPVNTVESIYEVGLYYADSSTTFSKLLPYPGTDINLWTNATLTTANARVSPQTLKIDFVTSGTTTAESIATIQDLSSYTGVDIIKLAFYATANTSSLRIRMGTDSSNYYEFLVSSPAVGYNIKSFSLSSATKTGSPNWNNIAYFAVRPSGTAGGNGSVYFDGIRIEQLSLSPVDLLVARTVYDSPFVTNPNLPTTIEYALNINVVNV